MKRKTFPGGKALLRQLQWVASRGMTASALDAIRSSVSPSLWNSFEAQVPGLPRHEETPLWQRSKEERQAYARAVRDTQAITAKTNRKSPKWRSLGPAKITNGQTYGKFANGDPVTVNVSGRVSAIAVDPADSSHILCGAAKGGIWERRGELDWAPRTDSASTLQTGALCFDPRNSAIAYCGTGEGNDDTSIGQGILVSKDGGTKWDSLCTDPFMDESFFDLQVDTGDSRRLFAATTGGLRISTNGGVKWSDPRKSGCSVQAAWSVAVHPAGGPGAEILAAHSDGLWRSVNGELWEKITLPEGPAGVDNDCFLRLAVAIAPSNPKVAYAWGAWDPQDPPKTDDNAPPRTARLWRRDEAGSWKVAPVPEASANDSQNIGQADYDWCLAVSPDSDAEVFCGGFDLFRGNFSNDQWTWANISSNGPGSSIHPDQHALAFSKDSKLALYAGCDGGLFVSADRGNSWKDCNNGLVITQFEYLALSQANADWLIGGTQDNGTDLWTNSEIWEQVAGGDGGRCAVRQDQPQTVFHTFFGLSLYRSDSAGYAPWAVIFEETYDRNEPGSLFYPPFACSSGKGDTMALGGNAVVYVYRDGGPWINLPVPNPGDTSVSVVTIPNSDEVWAGTNDGRIFVAKWRGTTWKAPDQPEFEQLKSPRDNGGWISDILPDAGGVWVTYSAIDGDRVFYSRNRGKKWLNMTGNLPALPVNTIQVDPADPNRIWVGLDSGVFEGRMKDQKTAWTPFCNGLPNVIVGDLVFHKATRRLRAGTQSRGVWEVQL